MDERRKVAFDFARDSTKQLLTLSTVILTATVALATAFDERIDGDVRVYLKAVWAFYLASVFFGSWTLFALTGTLEPKSRERDRGASSSADDPSTADAGLKTGRGAEQAEPSIRGRNVTLPSALQVVSFTVGTTMAVVAGWTAIT